MTNTRLLSSALTLTQFFFKLNLSFARQNESLYPLIKLTLENKEVKFLIQTKRKDLFSTALFSFIR